MKRSLNLMSPRSCQRVQLRAGLRLWSRVWAGSAVVLAVIGLVQWRLSLVEQSKLATVEAQYEPIREVKVENQRLRQQIEQLAAGERLPLTLAEHQPLLGLLTMAGQLVQQQDNQVYLSHIQIERDPLAVELTDRSQLQLGLEGVALDGEALTGFADTLRLAGLFDSVELERRGPPAAGTQQTFSIQCAN